jgi:hypothetical protein
MTPRQQLVLAECQRINAARAVSNDSCRDIWFRLIRTHGATPRDLMRLAELGHLVRMDASAHGVNYQLVE